MKRITFTLIVSLFIGLSYGQVGSEFGPDDVLLCDFEGVDLIVVDSLWTDTTMTTPITTQSSNITIVDNPFPLENESFKAAKYVRPAGTYKSVFMRFDEPINFTETPYLQVQVYPILGKSPSSTSVSISVMNDEGEIVAASGGMNNLPQDEWTTVTAFLGKIKSSDLYNTISITINAEDSLSNLGGTEYLIDQIGFKAPVGGGSIPATIFYETFGVYNDPWQQGIVPGQFTIPNAEGTDVVGPGEVGTAEAYASIGGFTSGIPFTFMDLNADTAAAFIARTWGMEVDYEGSSGLGRMQFLDYLPGTLETGNIDVSMVDEEAKFVLSFGFGTQTWWPYMPEIANARPKVEISVDGGEFYEIFSESDFLQSTGEFDDLGWGPMEKFQDGIFVLVEYPFTDPDGLPLPSPDTINLRMSYKAGISFWIDDLWLSAGKEDPGVGVTTTTNFDPTFTVFPNPASEYISTKGAETIVVSDLNGRIVLKASETDRLQVSGLAPGIYIVRVEMDGNIQTGKFIKN